MITKASICIVVVAGLCFGGSFLGTVAVRSQDVITSEPVVQSPIAKRLKLDPEQAKTVEAHDPSFVDDVSTLRTNLQEARSMLAAAFEDENATDDEIRRRVHPVHPLRIDHRGQQAGEVAFAGILPDRRVQAH